MMKILLITLLLASVSFCMIDFHFEQLQDLNSKMKQLNRRITKMANRKSRRLVNFDFMAQPLEIGAQVNSMVRRLSQELPQVPNMRRLGNGGI